MLVRMYMYVYSCKFVQVKMHAYICMHICVSERPLSIHAHVGMVHTSLLKKKNIQQGPIFRHVSQAKANTHHHIEQGGLEVVAFYAVADIGEGAVEPLVCLGSVWWLSNGEQTKETARAMAMASSLHSHRT